MEIGISIDTRFSGSWGLIVQLCKKNWFNLIKTSGYYTYHLLLTLKIAQYFLTDHIYEFRMMRMKTIIIS
jgi:hypothetical protein